MKAKVVHQFYDLKEEVERPVGDVFTCSKERFAQINAATEYTLVEEVPAAKRTRGASTDTESE